MGGISLEGGNSVAVDAQGNVYTTGYFQGNADFDPGPGTYTLSSGGSAIFVSKLDASGNFIWAKAMGGSNLQNGANSIAVDANGNVYTSGEFIDTVDFDPGPGSYTLSTNPGFYNIFISKLDASGNFVWAKAIGPAGSNYSYALALDVFANVYITGTFFGTVDFDPGVGIYNLTSGSQVNNLYVAKFDVNGNFIWAKHMNGVSSSYGAFGWSIGVDNSGNVYTEGTFSGEIDFDPGVSTYTLSSLNGSFISKLDASGNFLWAKQIDGVRPNGMALDPNANIISTGFFNGVVDFDPGVGTYTLATLSSSNSIAYISKLDFSGNFIWAKTLNSIPSGTPGAPSSTGKSITTDFLGNVYTTGKFNKTTDFNPGSGVDTLSSMNGNVFLSKLNSSGNFIWAGQIGGNTIDVGYSGPSIASDAASNIYLTGIFFGTCDFNPTVGIFTLNAIGGGDIFTIKLEQNANDVSENFLGDHLSIFPNPSSGIFTIEGEIIKAKIAVYDVIGKCVWSKEYRNETDPKIALGFQPKGIYFLEIMSEGQRTVKKIVID
jgi:hypothetical protein